MPAPSPRDTSSPLPAPQTSGGTRLALRILAVVAPVVFLQIAVVYPNSQQLAAMRSQVARLESTITELKGHGPSVGRATGLLVELAEQQSRLGAAEATLDRLVSLDRRITRGVNHAASAAASVGRYERLAERVEVQSQQLAAVDAALADLADLPARLESALDRVGRMAPAVAEVDRLAERIEQTRDLLDESLERVERVADRQEELAGAATRADSAGSQVEGLIRLAKQLEAPDVSVEAAEERLHALVDLKQSVLNQTEDLPEAFETFDLLVDLQADYSRASEVFVRAQRLMTDLVLLEPSIARIAAVIDPMIDRTTIAGLGGGELRMVLRELQQRRAATLAKINAVDAEASVAERSDDAEIK